MQETQESATATPDGPATMPALMLKAIKHGGAWHSVATHHPWTLDGATIATDGKMIVRADVALGHPAAADAYASTCRQCLNDSLPLIGWATAANLKAWAGDPQRPTKCNVCDGTKKVKCDECDGSGETECGACGSDCDCDRCDDGRMDCPRCGGQGECMPDSTIRPGSVPGVAGLFDRDRIAAASSLLPDDATPVRVEAGCWSKTTLLRLSGNGWTFVLLPLAEAAAAETAAAEAPALEVTPP